MNDTFVTIKQPLIRNTTKRILFFKELLMVYEMRHKNATKSFRILSCFIYNIIDKYFYIDYLACQIKAIK